MRRYYGRLTGALMGALGGPTGAIFGLVAGWLVDQYRATAPVTAGMQRFLRRPETVSDHLAGELYATASLSAFLLTVDGEPDKTAVHRALATDWPQGEVVSSSDDRRHRVSPVSAVRGLHRAARVRRMRQLRGPVLDYALVHRERIDPRKVARYAGEAFAKTPAGSDRLLSLLLEISENRGGMQVGPEFYAGLRLIAAHLHPGKIATETLGSYPTDLDPESCRVLGVSSAADREEIRRAYRHLVTTLHPDSGGALDEERQQVMQEAFVRVRMAYETLSSQMEVRAGADTTRAGADTREPGSP